MKSFFSALIFTIALIGANIMFTNKLYSVAQTLSEKTVSVYTHLKQNEVDTAIKKLENTTDEFEKNRVLLESTGNHEELLRIELAYVQTKEFINKKQIGDALANLSQIKILLEHLPGNFELKPENIL